MGGTGRGLIFFFFPVSDGAWKHQGEKQGKYRLCGPTQAVQLLSKGRDGASFPSAAQCS